MKHKRNDIVIGVVNKVTENGVFVQNMVTCVDENGVITLKRWAKVEVAIATMKEDGFMIFSEKLAEMIKEKVRKQEFQEAQQDIYNYYSRSLSEGDVCECEIVSVKQGGIKLTYEGYENCFVEDSEIGWGKQDASIQNYRKGQLVDAAFLAAESGTLFFSLKLLRDNPYSDDVYNLDTDSLLRHIGIGHNKFAGRVSFDRDNKNAFLVDIISYNNKEDESLQGELLINPYTGTNIKAIFGRDDVEKLENGCYYEVSLTVAPVSKRKAMNEPFLMGIVSYKKLAENPYRHIVNEVFMKSDNPHSNTTIARLLEEVGKQMYSSKDRTFFELLQNADDAAAPMSTNAVEVFVGKSDDCLLFCHSGCPFNRTDFIAISSAANSTKRKAGNKTGYKGIGFKSVFSDAESVHLVSGGFSVKFDKSNELLHNFHNFYYKARGCRSEEEYKQFLSRFSDDEKNFRGISDMPWQILPIWDDDAKVFSKIDISKHNVNIAIKTNDLASYEASISELAKQPEFLLFLRNIKRLQLFGTFLEKSVSLGHVVLRSESRTRRYVKKDYSDVKVSNQEFSKYSGLNLEIREITNPTTGETELHFFENGQDKSATIPNKLAEAQMTMVSFVAPTENGQLVAKDPLNSTAPIFAYLPTSDKRFPFPFFVNADFVLSSNRESVSGDNPWNIYLFAVIGRKLVEWVAELAANDCVQENYLNLLLPSLLSTQSSDSRRLAEFFNLSYSQALLDTPFVINNYGRLVKTHDIIIDDSGLSDIIGAEDFLDIIGTDKTLPFASVKWQILRNKIFNVDSIELEGESSVCSYLKKSPRLWSWIEENRNSGKLSAFYDWLGKSIRKEQVCGRSSKPWLALAQTLPLFSFNGVWRSFNKLEEENRLVLNKELVPLMPALQKMQFSIADQLVEDCPLPIAYVNYERLLSLVCENIGRARLSPEDKILLFFADFKDPKAKKKINDVGLFANENGERRALSAMFYNPSVPYTYLSKYRLAEIEYSSELNDYLIRKEQEVFSRIILQNISEILSSVSFEQLYADWQGYWSDEATGAVAPVLTDESIKTRLMLNSRSTRQMIDYLEQLPVFNLSSRNQYPSYSKESQLLQIAVKAGCLQYFLSKVCVDGLKVTEYLLNDAIDMTIDGRQYSFSLFDLLPYRRSNVLETIKRIVPEIASADIECKSMSPQEVKSELQQYLAVKGTVTLAQFAFISFLQKCTHGYTALGYDIKSILPYTREWGLLDCVKFCYESFGKYSGEMLRLGLDELGINSINGLFFDSSDLILPREYLGYNFSEILDWADDSDKKDYLTFLGVRKYADNGLIKWREAYYRRVRPTSSAKLSDIYVQSTFEWIGAKCGGFPVNEDSEPVRSKALLSLGKFRCVCDPHDTEQIGEYDLPQYRSWVINGGKVGFVLVKGKIVWRALYNMQHVVSFREGNYHKCPDGNTVLINGDDEQSTVQDIINDVARDSSINDFTLSDYHSLFFVSSQELNEVNSKLGKAVSELQSVKEDLERLRKFGSIDDIIRKLSKQGTADIDTVDIAEERVGTISYKHDCDNVRSFIGGGFDIDDDKIKSEHMLSKYRILQYVKSRYQLDISFDERSYVSNGKQYQKIRLADGRFVFPQSAKYGIWYLSSNIWRAVVEDGDMACVCTGDGADDFLIFDSKDLFAECINEKPNALIKISANAKHTVSESVDSVFPSENYDEDLHLMLMLKPTPKAEINSLYESVYKSNQDNTADF